MIDQYLKYYKLNDEAIKFLQDNLETITAALPDIMDKFYAYMVDHPTAGRFLRGHDISRLKKAQIDHWQFAITSGLGEEYVKRVERIGRAHEKIGLNPIWYIGGYSFVIELLSTSIMDTKIWKMAEAHKLVQVFQRLVLLDMALAISVYEETMVKALHSILGRMQGFTDEVGSRVENTTESVRQMNLAINEVAEQAHVASNSAATIAQQAQAGRGEAEDLIKVAQGVNSVLEIITNVAEQTNLLALNAAIESARAGDAGRGFAVVADEVRKLSGTTRESVDVISARIKELQAQTQNVVGQFDKMVSSLSEIQRGSISISAAVAEESTAMNHISEGFTSLHESVVNAQNEMHKLVNEATKK